MEKLLREQSPTLLLELEPGKKSASDVTATVPLFGIVEFQQLGNGDLRAKTLHLGEWLVLHQSNLKKLGVQMDVRTVIRLGNNGYVRVRQPGPQTRELNLASWVAHLKAVEGDPLFWQRRLEAVGFDEKGKVIWRESLLTRRENYDAYSVRMDLL